MRKFLFWLDENALVLLAAFLLLFIPLYPKWPLFDAIPGYLVRVRLEDIFVLLALAVFAGQVIRGKVRLELSPVTVGMGLYLLVGLASVISGILLTQTIPSVDIHIFKSLLHWGRRVEYFALFFIVFGSIKSLRMVKILVILLFLTLAAVTIYGFGQKYLYFPAWSTMNREFAKGWSLYLTEHARVLSTFGGHYDLAGYLVILLTLSWSFFFGLTSRLAKIAVGLVLAGGFWLLILTASRISFIAYLAGLTTVVFLWSFRKGLRWGITRLAVTAFLSLLVMVSFGDLSERFLRLLKVNERIASVRQVLLKPLGSKPTERAVFLENNIAAVTSLSDQPPTPIRPADVTGEEEVLLVASYSATGVKTLVPTERVYSQCALRLDLSTCIRLESTWPRAIAGLKTNLLLGSGYATLTKHNIEDFTEAESTDSDLFRSLGETGILGFAVFFGTLFLMGVVVFRALGGVKDPFVFSLSSGFLGFLVGLVINSLYIDIFEASKVAYSFWGISGLALGTIYLLRDKIRADREPLSLGISLSSVRDRMLVILRSDLFWVLLILLMASVFRIQKIDQPLADWHSWRQADTSAVTRNFDRFHEINWLYPAYDDLSSIPSGRPNPNGYRMVEFPIYNALSFSVKTVLPEVSVETAGRLTTIVFSLAATVFIFLIGRKVLSRRAAYFAALVFAVLPYSVFYGRTILPDPTMVALSLGSLWFGLKFADDKKYLFLVLAVVLAAVALLVKPFALFLLLPLGYLWVSAFGIRPKTVGLIIFSSALMTLPLVLWRQWIGQFPEGIPASSWLLNGDGIRFKGAFWYWLFADRIGRLILGYWGLILFGFGLVRKTDGKYALFPLIFFLSSILYLVIFATGNVRHDYYQILLLPSVSLLVGLGIDSLLFANSPITNNPISRLLAVVSLLFMLGFGWYHVRDFYNINHPEIVEAGKKVEELTDWKSLVIAPYDGDTAFLYQTSRKGWPIIEGSIEDMIRKGAHYYVSVRDDETTKQIIAESWPVWVPKPEKVVKKYKLLDRTPAYAIVQLVPDKDLPQK